MGRKTRSFVDLSYSTKNDNNVVETSISNDDDPFLSEDKLKELLEENIEGKPNLLLGILIGINEVVDNILEHSDGEEFKEGDRTVSKAGVVSIEYCDSTNHLMVTIWDFGKGIVNTLSQEYDTLSREEILCKAFDLNVTRHRKIWDSRGNGLAKIKEFVLKSKGSIICETNEFKITFSPLYPNGYLEKIYEPVDGTHFEIKIGCEYEIDIYPIFDTDVFEDFFDLEEEAFPLQIKDFIPLNSHQVGIKIKNIILDKIEKSSELIRLDFDGVEIFTDSFIQQVTTILSEEIGFELFQEKIRFSNLNKVLEGMVKEKIYIASEK